MIVFTPAKYSCTVYTNDYGSALGPHLGATACEDQIDTHQGILSGLWQRPIDYLAIQFVNWTAEPEWKEQCARQLGKAPPGINRYKQGNLTVQVDQNWVCILDNKLYL